MPKYRVTMLVDATVDVVVEAESEEEAKDKALINAYAPTLCHQCSDDLEVGDVISAHSAYVVPDDTPLTECDA